MYPWHEHSFIRGNLAAANIRDNLYEWLKLKQGVHAETALATIGALAGFAAQNIALKKAAKTTQETGHVRSGCLIVAQAASGPRYLLGSDILQPIFGLNDEKFALWGLAGGAVVSKGVPQSSLPDLKPVVEHVSNSMGTPAFGRLTCGDEHQPGFTIPDALKIFWPRICQIFHLPLPAAMPTPPPGIEVELDEAHWPVILGCVAGQILMTMSQWLDIVLGYRIVMEAAIIAAKIDPETIVPGKWDISITAGAVAVREIDPDLPRALGTVNSPAK